MSSNEKSSNESGRIIRGKMTQFAAIPAVTMNDARLSMSAAAVLHYMIFRAGIDDWNFCVADIVKHFKTGRKGCAVRNAINELIELGYVVRQQLRDDAGRMIGTRYIVNDISESAPQFSRPAKTDGESEITRAAPVVQPVKPQPAPVAAAPAAKPAKKPAGATDTVSEALSEQHQKLARVYNDNRGGLPEKRSRDGQIIISTTLSKLMNTLIKNSDDAENDVKLATLYAVDEARREPDGWVARNCDIENIVRNADRWSGLARQRKLDRAASAGSSTAASPAWTPPAAI